VSFAVFVAFGVMAMARAAGACPMCLSGTDEGRQAYYATTALLIVVPVALWGSIGFWLYRAVRRRDARAGTHPVGVKPEGQARASVYPGASNTGNRETA
jgi:hypothetical protein